ncbi:MAG TPA: hypothetical protein VGT41_04820 [Candidatus Babeliales bacterium]|nr:hypothetical protein [Candidatus Babeliales bacterium]
MKKLKQIAGLIILTLAMPLDVCAAARAEDMQQGDAVHSLEELIGWFERYDLQQHHGMKKKRQKLAKKMVKIVTTFGSEYAKFVALGDKFYTKMEQLLGLSKPQKRLSRKEKEEELKVVSALYEQDVTMSNCLMGMVARVENKTEQLNQGLLAVGMQHNDRENPNNARNQQLIKHLAEFQSNTVLIKSGLQKIADARQELVSVLRSTALERRAQKSLR